MPSASPWTPFRCSALSSGARGPSAASAASAAAARCHSSCTQTQLACACSHALWLPPLAQLGFVPAFLPEGQLGPHSFTCTARLALGLDLVIKPLTHNSYVFMAQLEDKRRAVLKLSKHD